MRICITRDTKDYIRAAIRRATMNCRSGEDNGARDMRESPLTTSIIRPPTRFGRLGIEFTPSLPSRVLHLSSITVSTSTREAVPRSDGAERKHRVVRDSIEPGGMQESERRKISHEPGPTPSRYLNRVRRLSPFDRVCKWRAKFLATTDSASG